MRGRKPTPKRGEILETELEPPIELTSDARTEWRRVSTILCADAIINELDRGLLAAYCQAYGRWVQAERVLAKMAELDPIASALTITTKNGNAIQNPIIGIANKALADLARYAVELGMTPSARARIDRVPKPGKKEVAKQAAESAGRGTDWGDDLAPTARAH